MFWWRRESDNLEILPERVSSIDDSIQEALDDLKADNEDLGKLIKDIKLPSPNARLELELEAAKREIERLNTQLAANNLFIQNILCKYVEKSVTEPVPKIELVQPATKETAHSGPVYTLDRLKAMSLSEKRELGIINSYSNGNTSGPKGRLP